MMYGWNGGWGWGAWLAMGFMMVVFWGLVAAVVVVALRSSHHRHEVPPRADVSAEDDALRVLDTRFARGEIGAEKYTSRRDLLRTR